MQITVETQPVIDRFQNEVPVNVIGLAEALGLRVWESDSLPGNVSGKIFVDPQNGGSSGYSIVVRATDPFVRRRFTVAHEIAHFVLHRPRIGSSLVDDALYRSNLSSTEEIEANRLAAAILMPEKLVRSLVRNGPPLDLSLLASAFQVSKDAMRIRLKMLGLSSNL